MQYEPSAFISMANLTREIGLDALHMRALYNCSQLPTHLVVNGVQTTRGAAERLSTDDVIACIEAHSRLSTTKLQMMEDVAWAWHTYPCDWGAGNCSTSRKNLAARRHTNLWKFDADPLKPSEEWLKQAAQAMASNPLCQRCTDKFRNFIEQRRMQILSKLEDYFTYSIG